MARIVVGMSGGVDSSVSALLLKLLGHEVIGLFMKNWEEDGVCPATRDFEDVARVCSLLDIPFYGVNFVEQYWEGVFASFLADLKKGYTPNPDILCNREIKFKVFLEKAKLLGADFLATGHYCQVGPEKELLKGSDPQKDQSYFLYTLKKEILKQVLFPIGHLPKAEVRALAKEHGLPVHDKKDSTGICFIGKRDFKEFISHYIPYQKGLFETLGGQMVGEHDGAAYYTIGQRKGLGIGGPGEAWFVVAKDVGRNVVIVEQGNDHPALYAKKLSARDLSLVSDQVLKLPYRCKAKVRYRQEDQDCLIEEWDGNRLLVSFDEPQRAITSGQAIVFYQDDVCLGGASIEETIY